MSDIPDIDPPVRSSVLIKSLKTCQAEVASLRQQLAEAREALESLKALTIKRSDRMQEAEGKSLMLEAELFDAREALEPFASWAKENVELVVGSINESGEVIPGYFQWKDAPMRERIVDWFGPSDFGAAIRSIAEKDDQR